MTVPSTTAPNQLVALDLPARARELLAAGDERGFRRLFALTGESDDPHRRYWAGATLIELGARAAADPRAGRARARIARATADGALELLEHQPSEPRLLRGAAAAMELLACRPAAAALREAASRLDRGLAPRAEGAAPRGRQAGSHPADSGLIRRSLEVAARARPAEGLRLSLCMIVRDEEEMLPRCLGAVADAVDEVVVVDTGSVDRTIEIARSFGARVIRREWTGSFAEARNASFDAASGDWLMYLDADEVLVREDASRLRGLTGRTWCEAFLVSETNYTGELEDGIAVTHNALRVFRNRADYRFEGRLHEQIANRLPGYLPERLLHSGVRVEHYGYLGAVRDSREKSRRNIELLRLAAAESPPSAFLHFNLGSEYAAAGNAAAALDELERAWELLELDAERDSYTFTPALASRLVMALRACERPAEALALAREALERFPAFTDLVLEQAHASLALGRREQAVALLRRCIEMGDAPGRYTARVGSGTHLPRLALAEVMREQGRRGEAIELLRECLQAPPAFLGAVLPWATAMLAAGAQPPAVAAELERHLGDGLSPAARFMLGTAFYESGAVAAGEEQWRCVLVRQPHSGRARVALGEALLAQRRYGEAAEVAAGMPVEDPLAANSARTELFARIADGGDGATAALARARTAGMAAEELDLFAAWRDVVSEGSTDIELSAEAVPPLEVLLEALLRVHDFDAFAGAVGLLARTPLRERDRRELLADMYLRRGFVASAAEQWMSVMRDEPDVRALVGLARVAARRGMNGEATDFAAAALARDPENEAAAELLSHARAADTSGNAAAEASRTVEATP